ncbi:MAG: 16S rRNA (cytosine(967)-C(5))-methyltransferase RsmB [Pseudomonadota bacterium]
MAKKLNSRAVAASLSWQVIDRGQSLDAALSNAFADPHHETQDRSLIQELVYGVCRWYGDLDECASQLLQKPIRNKDRVIHFVLLVGIYQLRYLSTAPHAAVAETVAACRQLNKQWAAKLVNGCLRTYQRNAESAPPDNLPALTARDRLSHPGWIVDAIEAAWPEHSEKIFTANNARPPMCLRTNQRVVSRDDYLRELAAVNIAAEPDPYSAEGIILEAPVAVGKLPGFASGSVSVQDTAAQLAAGMLDVQAGQAVLDACAAPGGKTAHLLEGADNNLRLDALDISARRCEQLHDTLARLALDAQVYTADASLEPSWPVPGSGYDRILLDAPCSGLGVIRRHPDIKHHRQPDDIVQLLEVQAALLNRLWSLLKPGGLMLYISCSILPAENESQIQEFLERRSDAQLADFTHPRSLELAHGKQTLPGVHNMDGFYYCLLRKTA